MADLSALNQYIPVGDPLLFTIGTAELEADISLSQENAGGYMRPMVSNMEARVDEQSICADFSANIFVTDGTLGGLALDISGSELKT